MIGDLKENNIEWYTGSKTATVSFTQKKYINRIKRLAEKYPLSVEIVAENPDGSITAHIPTRAIHVQIYGQKTGTFEGVGEESEDGEDNAEEL